MLVKVDTKYIVESIQPGVVLKHRQLNYLHQVVLAEDSESRRYKKVIMHRIIKKGLGAKHIEYFYYNDDRMHWNGGWSIVKTESKLSDPEFEEMFI